MSGPLVLALRLLLALALYVFLGWTLLTIWQDLKRTASRVAKRKIPVIRLEVRTKNREAVSRSFSQPEVTLGRDPACDIRLEDATVSAHHAKLNYHHGQWWVEDLQSTNGTKLNKEKLTIPTVLTTGDEIRCGKMRLKVNLGGKAIISQESES